MNERIKELEEQCWSYQMRVFEVNGELTYGVPEQVFNREKFAELLIKDVVEQIITRERNAGEWYQHDIFEHYGVEE